MANKRKSQPQNSVDAFRSMFELSQPASPNISRIRIEDEIAREKKLKNDDIAQDIALKKVTLNRLFIMLVGETILLFAFAFLQATKIFGFQLEEWSFKLLTTVTITQITVMLYVAVNYLFPKKK